MRFDDFFLESHDMDVFFQPYGVKCILPVHCATFGSLLPEEMNDVDYYNCCMTAIANMPYRYTPDEIEIEYENVRYLLGEQIEQSHFTFDERVAAYVRTFVNMACRGFWSYDRFHRAHSEPELEDKRFILIAHPRSVSHDNLQIELRTCKDIILINNINQINNK